MGDVLAFRTADRGAGERRLADIARRLIDELGEEAGCQVGAFARSGYLDSAARTRLLALDPIGLAVYPMPLPVPPFALYASRHPRLSRDPGHRWLRETIGRLAER